MTKLSVNINKIATLRNARGGNTPNVCQVALDCERFGAQGITVHPRPDERHIRRSDVWELKSVLKTEFNIEGYPSVDFINLVKSVKPHQVTLVPDPPEAITSSAGWDTVKNLEFLKEVVAGFQSEGIRVSIFVDTNPANINSAALTGIDLMVSMVPFSYSRAMMSDVRSAPTLIMMTAMIPGIIKLRLSRSSLNQIRMRPSTGGFICSSPCRFRKLINNF